jgi:hypothetical protein
LDIFFLAGFFLFTVSFPSPTVADLARLNKAIALPLQVRHSNSLAVGQALAFRGFDALHKPFAVSNIPVIPTEFKFSRVFGQVFPAYVVP